MPEPKPNESRKSYMSRCISHLVKNEGKTQKQAAGKCFGMWDQMKKKARRRAHAGS